MKVGILSLAHVHADGYLALLPELPDVRLIGFSDDDTERAQATAARTDIPWLGSDAALLAERPDAVIICSENAKHRAAVEQAAAAGAHVLCEKPIATTLADALSMREACERHGVSFMTAFPMRFDASLQALKAMLKQGELGRVYGINGINHAECPSRHRAWFVDPELAGGGAVMDHIVHLADLYRWLLASEITAVYAEVGNPFLPESVAVDTACLASVTLSNGVFASIDASWSRPSSYPRWGQLKLEVVGERGAVAIDAFAQHLTLYSPHASRQPSWVNWGGNPNRAMLAAFIASVRLGAPPPVTWQDGYQALRVALACYASQAGGAVVPLGGLTAVG
ncbi:MAG: Gfo/Idh/MocA family oxidoreductase [Truepera sp.]|nr:Gfo/Idh/MocA family oxidoreductase [Truepera sp.]MBS3968028.1 Gfo/Idh/MocA family oxidoreductase [Truepera sp.]